MLFCRSGRQSTSPWPPSRHRGAPSLAALFAGLQRGGSECSVTSARTIGDPAGAAWSRRLRPIHVVAVAGWRRWINPPDWVALLDPQSSTSSGTRR